MSVRQLRHRRSLAKFSFAPRVRHGTTLKTELFNTLHNNMIALDVCLIIIIILLLCPNQPKSLQIVSVSLVAVS